MEFFNPDHKAVGVGSSAFLAVEMFLPSSSVFEAIDQLSPVILGRSPYRVLSAGPAEPRFFNEVVTPPPPPFSHGLGTVVGRVYL